MGVSGEDKGTPRQLGYGGGGASDRRRRGREGQIIKVRNNKRRILGPEWSISEVVTLPPHNLDKPDVLVASINNSINIVYSELQFHFTNLDVKTFIG